MHYIRLLRAPKVTGTDGRLRLSLLFTITTDLGDSFLYPDEYIELQLVAHAKSSTRNSPWPLSEQNKIHWQPGMRVAKPTIDIPRAIQQAINSGSQVQICVRPVDSARSADGLHSILAVPSKKRKRAQQASEDGLIMPAWVNLVLEDREADVATRKLHLGDPSGEHTFVEVEEEIGESIARHIWDAGVVALCAVAGIGTVPEHESSKHACMQAMRDILDSQQSLSILEIGCGVGILGVGLGAIYPMLRKGSSGGCTILMTDLPEAEARARANISRLEGLTRPGQGDETCESAVKMLYENLDWEDGRLGKFGLEVTARSWDLVMLSDCTYNVDVLPALVETLSALHSSNLEHISKEDKFTTKVFLATKPRHESENALFGLMDKQGWETLHKQVLPLPVLGSEPESVEMYLFVKS